MRQYRKRVLALAPEEPVSRPAQLVLAQLGTAQSVSEIAARFGAINRLLKHAVGLHTDYPVSRSG
jgi:hypothetical protein